jgi:hypothetical protein
MQQQNKQRQQTAPMNDERERYYFTTQEKKESVKDSRLNCPKLNHGSMAKKKEMTHDK